MTDAPRRKNTPVQPDVPELFGLEGVKYRVYKRLATFLENLSDRRRTSLADFLASALWLLLPGRKRYTIDAVQKHLELPRPEATRIARKSYTENCRSFLEIFVVGRFDPAPRIRSIHTPEVWQQLITEQGPVVATTAHLGSWELMASLVSDYAPGKEKLVVVRSQQDRAIDRLMKEMRSAAGMLAVGHRQASKVVLESLTKRNCVAAFLVDHNCNKKEAVFLPFFNDTAAVNAGPAMLALRSRAAVYPLFLLRLEGGGLALHVEPPLYTRELKGSIAERVTTIARYYSDSVEKVVRLYPEQWFWMHKRWKTREE